MEIITDKKIQSRPNKQTQFAFYLSILTALFSIYQWWNSEMSTKINATVDISRKFFEDKNFEAYMNTVTKIGDKHDTDALKNLSSDLDSQRNLIKYFYHMDYIASLSNKNLIDIRYMPDLLKCNIFYSSFIYDRFNDRFKDIQIKDSKRFIDKVKHLKCDM